MARTPRKVTPRSLENIALHYIQRFATSSENLRRVLIRRVERSARFHGTDPAEGTAAVDDLVTRYQASGLLDDGAYAEGRARTLHRRGAPAYAIRARLREKGLSEDHIEAAVAGLAESGEDVEFTAAVNLARRRRLGPFRANASDRGLDKDLATLARAGFSYHVARRIVAAETPEQLEEPES